MALTTVDQGLLGTYAQYTGFKNRIINGDMRIDQRNAGASVTITTASPYTLDRWQAYASQNSKYSVQQNAGSVTPPSGFTYYLGATSLSAYSVTSTDIFTIRQIVEGYNIADLNWGTANAKPIVISFWVYSSLTGTFGGAACNNGQTRSYPFTYTISSANTWEFKTVSIAGDTSGTWNTGNGRGIDLFLSIGVGSTYTGTAGAWAGTAYYNATGATSVVGTNGATFYITGVQLEAGSTATSFDRRDYGRELIMCQRYFEQMYYRGSAYGNSSNAVPFTIPMKATKRTSPTVIVGSDPEGWTTNYPGPVGSAYNSDSALIQNSGSVPVTGFSRFGAILSISAEL